MGEFEDEEPGRKDASGETSGRDRHVLVSCRSGGCGRGGNCPSSTCCEEVEPGSVEAARVLSLHQTMKTRARLYAHHLRQLSTFFREDPAVRGLLDDADVTALKVATGLRCSYFHAQAQVTDAYTAVEWMPLTFEHLRVGDLPEAWHHSLLRHVRRLPEEQVRQVDAHMAGVELPSVSKATFDKQVTLAVALASAGTVPTPPVAVAGCGGRGRQHRDRYGVAVRDRSDPGDPGPGPPVAMSPPAPCRRLSGPASRTGPRGRSRSISTTTSTNAAGPCRCGRCGTRSWSTP